VGHRPRPPQLAPGRCRALTTFSLFNLFFSISAKDQVKTVFSLDTFSDKTFVISTGLSVVAIILATVLGPLQKLLDTTSLDVQQWLICLCVSLSIIVISEIRKVFLRRSAEPAVDAEAAAPSVVVPAT
jgi:P-type Ca2+ transporter type 2C